MPIAAPMPIEKTHRIESIPLKRTKKPGSFVALFPQNRGLGRLRQRTTRQFSAAAKRKFPARFAGSILFLRKTRGFPGAFPGTRLAGGGA
jgi:hypothetical protein